MEALYYWIIIVCLTLGLPIYFSNWITKGMLFKLMKVFASRGQKLLVEVIHPIQNYYVIGKVQEGYLIVKDRATKAAKEAKIKRINVNTGDVFRSMGVNCLRYDETGNRIVRPDFSTVSGFDAIKQENLYIRALYDPKTGIREKYQLYILVAIGLTLVIVGLIAYNQSVMAEQVLNISKHITTAIATVPVV